MSIIMLSSLASATVVGADTPQAQSGFAYKDSAKTAVVNGENEYPVTDDKISVGGATYKLVDTVDEFLAIKDALTSNYLLMANMDFTTVFTQYVIDGAFEGILDGNGKALNDLKITIPKSGSSAIFKQCIGRATVKNMTVNVTFNNNTNDLTCTGNSNVAAIVGGVTNAGTDVRIENVTVNIDAQIKDKVNGSPVRTVSGIAGAVLGTITIADCTVNGTIDVTTGSKYGYACGVLYFTNVATGNITVRDTVNNASIRVRGTEASDDVTCASGIMGIMQDNGKVAFINCVNNGKLDAYYRAAGIIGIARKKTDFIKAFSMTDCKNNGDMSVVHTDNKIYNLASYGFDDTQGRAGAVAVSSVLDFLTLQNNEEKYYALTNDIDLGNSYDAATILAGFTKGKIDFAGYKIIGSKNLYTANAANVLQPDVRTVIMPILKAYQTTKIEATTTEYDVRVVAAMDGYSHCKEIGFDIKLNGAALDSVSCWTLYTSIKSEFGAKTHAASEFGDDYVVLPVLEGLKVADGKATVEITPWIITSDGSKVSGAAVTFTVDPAAE